MPLSRLGCQTCASLAKRSKGRPLASIRSRIEYPLVRYLSASNRLSPVSSIDTGRLVQVTPGVDVIRRLAEGCVTFAPPATSGTLQQFPACCHRVPFAESPPRG